MVASYLLILGVPRTYSSSTSMAPELSANTDMNSLSDIASSFGFDLGNMQSVDAISPLLYPDLMNDNGFVTKLFKVKIQTIDGSVKSTYYDYLRNEIKAPWWSKVMYWLMQTISPSQPSAGVPTTFDPYHLSKKDDTCANAVRGSIKIATDKKTGVINITTETQDPMVAKILADSTKALLQQYITNYRTTKARNDVEHYRSLVNKAKRDYERVRQAYGAYSDANTDVILESFKAKREDMENDMQLKYTAYSTLVTQLNAAQAKLQDRTPAFTTIQGAEVPIKPSGPKRMMFVLGMMFLTAIVITLWYSRDLIFKE